MFCLGIQFGWETTGCGFHIVNNWLVRLTHGLISLVNDNHADNYLKEILSFVYYGRIVNNQPKNSTENLTSNFYFFFWENIVCIYDSVWLLGYIAKFGQGR